MRSKMTSLVSCIIFIILIIKITVSATYLFRNVDNNRLDIIGMYEEDPLDMVYIGSSATYQYWQSLKAWNDCGFMSYAYATNSLEGDGILYYMKEVLKTHKPKLFVFEMRDNIEIAETLSEYVLRFGTDNMDLFSANRWQYIHNFFKIRNVPEEADVLSCYLDIFKYHTNIGNLALPEAWSYIDNRAKCKNKGWEWVDAWESIPEPIGFKTEERKELGEREMNVLIELLEFCKSQDAQVLFVVSPMAIITKDSEAKYNTVGDIVNKYGYNFINANDYYREIGLDFSKDFYNIRHVNLFGAEKYTAFLEKYIKENYDLPDHRTEEEYKTWHDEYARFAQEEAEHKVSVGNLINAAEQGIENMNQ
ncbi:hypothetical protein C810_03865 [Lachnospiraceae bacterium A2]|jgi:hypothetical protein|nr:hypothetical protein C810_03865 [Lachnospiraceae bacterium A2]